MSDRTISGGKPAAGTPGSGIFPWERVMTAQGETPEWFDEATLWAGFPREFDETSYTLPDWAIGPFTRYAGNPVLSPSPDGWDCGRYGGGVHNGSALVVDGKLHYIYRGELMPRKGVVPGFDDNYICDIGLAVSDDGIHFVKDTRCSPFFRKGEDERLSFEDVSLVRYEGTYYLFCNRWYWPEVVDGATNGAFVATSTDLRNWTKRGLCYPGASRIHRNPVILQTPDNEAVRVNGKFVMYLNEGLIGYSDDLIHWESHDRPDPWPGGENCFALVDWSPKYPDNILVFTGGPHSGRFYAVGEVLIDRSDPGRAIEWLPRPVLAADPNIPWEDGRSATPPYNAVSEMRDCIFFNGFTRWQGKWWAYYGGSEVYTCLATAPA